MKVLFLDIDGVMNSHQALRMYYRQDKSGSGRNMPFCPIACSNLQEIMARVPDLRIVVSSTWRLGRTMDELRSDLAPMGIAPERIIDKTPAFINRFRGHEIKDWLEDHPEVTEFVIVDDDSDMGSLMDKLVKTDTRMGLMWDKAQEILTRFGDVGRDGYF